MSTTNPPHPAGRKKAPSHPTPASASPPVPPAPAYVPLKWSYPFARGDNNEEDDAHSFFEALSNAEDGFYPLGANGIWHGGIHFDTATGQILKQEAGVRAIADGEVVAYRIDSKYPVLKYQDGKSCMYSTGFVLVRHKLVLPPAQNVSGTASAASPASGSASASTSPAASAGEWAIRSARDFLRRNHFGNLLGLKRRSAITRSYCRWQVPKGVMKEAGMVALIFTITLDTAEWPSDYKQIGPDS